MIRVKAKMINWTELNTIVSVRHGDRLSTASRCRHLIMTAITTGALPPGERLIEADLGHALNVSRTPLREALAALKAEGVLHHDSDGLRIRQLGWHDIHDLYEMRSTLEGMAARGAAEKSSAAEKSVINSIATTEARLIERGDEPDKLAQHNSRFHRAILQAAQNPFLIDALNRLSHLLVLLGTTAYSLPRRVSSIEGEHHAINMAIQSGDGDGAEAAMKTHLSNALTARLELLSISDQQDMD
ncbi:MAG: GntR family transcriptional regulator [Alphaproteobacteria bacterium]|nr:GntR family transcriptional regulator [Alphaproteobacteria bacterium]